MSLNQKIGSTFWRSGGQYGALHRGKSGNDLHYRGYDILDLAEHWNLKK